MKTRTIRKLTLIEMVTSIVVIIITVLGMVIYASIASSVGIMVESIQEKNFNREIEVIKNELVSYVDVIEIILGDNAAVPIVTQAVLQPEYILANLKDFLDDIKILNEQYNTTLLDLNGQLIYSNKITFIKEYSSDPWVKEVMEGSKSSYKGVSSIEGNHYWTIAVPVIYNGNPEGILVTEIPIERAYNHTKRGERLEDIEIEIMKGQESIFLLGNVEEGLEVTSDLEALDIRLRIVVDQRDSLKMIDGLKSTLLMIILSFILIAVIVLIVVSKRFIIKPITDLKKMIDAFMADDTFNEINTDVAVVEINDLSQQYIEMSKTIEQRENALKMSETLQIGKNEKLEALLKQLESTQSLIIQQEKLASIGRLAAGVAHELNNPIGFVNGNFEILEEYMPVLIAYVEFLKTGQNDEAVDFEDIDYILDDIPKLLVESEEGFIRIVDIVQNLKDYSRIDMSQDETYDINRGVKTTLTIAKNEYKNVARINLDLNEVPHITANGSEINEVLLNLIVNASQALADYKTDREKQITIKTFTKEAYLYCEISDNGPGISNDIIDKIYDPFFTTKAPGKGTGLGLNIAYNIIKNKHDGELIVNSVINEGTLFTIKLPKDGED